VNIVGPSLSSDGSELFFSTFGTPAPVTELNTSSDQGYPSISGDGHELYFESALAGNLAIFAASRIGPGAMFTNVHEVTELDQNGTYNVDPEQVRDGSTIVFASRPGPVGGADLFIATRTCQ
jgi:Tol biopolymer transport system component